MQLLISLLLTFIFLIGPIQAEEAPFVAVFCSSDLSKSWKDFPHHVDLMFKADRFELLDNFLIQVRNQAKGRRVVLDISVHGDPGTGLLCIKDGKKWHMASMGMVLNHIEDYLDNYDLVFESCFCGYVYDKSLHTSALTLHGTYLWLENYNSKEDPLYPIWGVERTVNLSTLALEEFIHHRHRHIKDVRSPNRSPINLTKDSRRELNSTLMLMRYLDTTN